MKTALRYLTYDPDPRGNERYYVRLKVGERYKKRRIRQPFKNEAGDIHPDFMVAYWAALEELRGSVPVNDAPTPPREDTFNWLFDQYYRSSTFLNFDPSTQKDKRSVFDRFAETAGDLPYKRYRREDMERSQHARRETPGAADKLVSYMRSLFNWAMQQKPALISHNPAVGVERINRKKGGFHTWTPDEIDRYRTHWRVGTIPRLAMELMITIGARRSDAAMLGPKHEFTSDGERWLRFTAHKGRNRYPVEIEAKLTPEFIEAVRQSKTGSRTYIVNARGAGFTIESFGNAFKRWCEEAELPLCSAHGLRKAAAVAYAESGATAPQLCAVFGWTNLKTAQIYIEQAEKRRLRRSAFANRAEYERQKSVSVLAAKKQNETNKEKSDAKTE